MKTRIDEDIKKGVMFKRIVCDKCGKVYYGKCIDRCDDAGYSTYEDDGYDAYIIHPLHKGLHRKEMFLCRQCAEDIDAKIEKIFVKDGAADAIEKLIAEIDHKDKVIKDMLTTLTGMKDKLIDRICANCDTPPETRLRLCGECPIISPIREAFDEQPT